MIEFAQGQIRTMGSDGKKYVRRCIAHWRQVYGQEFANRVAAALNKESK
jgi:hypothetical protein